MHLKVFRNLPPCLRGSAGLRCVLTPPQVCVHQGRPRSSAAREAAHVGGKLLGLSGDRTGSPVRYRSSQGSHSLSRGSPEWAWPASGLSGCSVSRGSHGGAHLGSPTLTLTLTPAPAPGRRRRALPCCLWLPGGGAAPSLSAGWSHAADTGPGAPARGSSQRSQSRGGRPGVSRGKSQQGVPLWHCPQRLGQ